MLDGIKRWTAIGAAALAAYIGGPALAQGFGEEGDEVKVSAFVADGESASVAPGGNAVIAVVLDHADKWHTNLNVPIIPPEMGDFPAVPTVIDVMAPEGVEVGTIQWPEPKAVKVDFLFTGEPLDFLTYAGRAVAYVPVRIAADTSVGTELVIPIAVSYQACDDQTCLIPTTSERAVRFVVASDAGDAVPVDGDFAGFDRAVFDAAWSTPNADPVLAEDVPGSPERDGTIAEATESTVQGETQAEAAASGATFFGIPVPESGAGFIGALVLMALSAVGGFVLNLTPCVLPVIPIKIMTLTQHAGESRGRAIYLGIWMALGVTAFWFALGVPAAAFSGAADASRIFGLWWVTTPIGLIIIAMSLGLMGMFAINLPQKAYMINPKADNASGSFLFGVMTGVLGLPCFGFVAGALIPAAATFSPLIVVLVFTSLGAGMAAPYLVLAAFPQLVDRLPRTGPASELVKQFMGLLLLAAGLFFAGTGLISLAKTYPYVGGQLHIVFVTVAVVAAGGWLAWKTFKISKQPGARVVFGGLGVLVAAAGVWLSVAGLGSAAEEHDRRQTEMAELEAAEIKRVEGLRAALEQVQALALEAAELGGGDVALFDEIASNVEAQLAANSDSIPTTFWVDYSPAVLETALDAGHAVFVDFTADWCINCKIFEKATLDKDPVASRLRADDVIMLKVDMSVSNPDGDALLEELNRVGLPTWAVFGPGLDQPRVVQAGYGGPVVDAVLTAIDDALAASTAAASQPDDEVWAASAGG